MESILEGTQASSAYGGERFETSNRADNAGPPDLPADESRGHDFVSFNGERNFYINILSPIPLKLFQLFVSICLVKNRLFILKDGFHTSSIMARLIAGIPPL
jgi:hypothetical protein